MRTRLLSRRPLTVLCLSGTAVALAACGASPTGVAAQQGPATAADTAVTSARIAPATGGADYYFGRMSEAQRVGQLFMTGGPADAVGSTTLQQITDDHIGSVMLTGRSTIGVSGTAAQTRSVQARATSSATAGVPELIATDQEGGYVQVLSGPGFSTMPTGLTQGGYATATLQSDATTWGKQLHAAGVNLDLAPVMDTVPSAAFAPHNPPIGYYDREYGYDPATVASHGTAFVRGMAAAGVDTAVKHFPGLGRVTANTDTSATVVDSQTTRNDSYVGAFDAGLASPSQVVMVSSATYSKIDPTQAAVLSPTVITGMLRGDAQFAGVVMTDDINGKALSAVPVADRATRFIAAGGDLILSVTPSTIPAMYQAVLARAGTDAGFKAQVDVAARRVLLAKQRLGLIPGSALGDLEHTRHGVVALWRPSTGVWSAHGYADVHWGVPGDIPAPADLTGSGSAQDVIFRPSTGQWYVPGQPTIAWGQSGDVPVPGDYTGSGRAQQTVFRPSTGQWWVHGQPVVQYGQQGDIPVDADYDGLGRTQIAVWRPSTGVWSFRGEASVSFGQQGDIPVPADYDGDGRTDIAVFRPSTGQWFVRGRAAVTYGQVGDVPVPADYNGDGAADIALFRPSTGVWSFRHAASLSYGRAGDVLVG